MIRDNYGYFLTLRVIKEAIIARRWILLSRELAVVESLKRNKLRRLYQFILLDSSDYKELIVLAWIFESCHPH